MSKLSYPDPQGYYAIDLYGQLKWVSTPFTVSCIDAVNGLKENQQFTIEQVAKTPENETVFIIGNTAYSHEHFMVAMPEYY